MAYKTKKRLRICLLHYIYYHVACDNDQQEYPLCSSPCLPKHVKASDWRVVVAFGLQESLTRPGIGLVWFGYFSY